MAIASSTALILGGVIAAGGAIGGAAISAGSSEGARKQIERSEKQQLDLAREQLEFQKQQAERAEKLIREAQEKMEQLQAPLRDIQMRALQKLETVTQPGSPEEQAEREFLTERIQQQLAAQGILRSKEQIEQLGTLEAALRGQRLNTLQQLAGLGATQNVAAQTLGAGQTLAQIPVAAAGLVGSSLGQLGFNLADIARARAQQQIAAGQIGSTLVSQLTNIGQNLLIGQQNLQQMELQNKLLQQLLSKNIS